MLYFSRWKIAFLSLTCLFFCLCAAPNVPALNPLLPAWFKDQTMNLGLDLRGGSHLLLEVDFDRYLHDHVQTLRDEVRQALRKERIGYRNLTVKDASVGFTLRPETLGEGPSLEEIIAEIDPDLTVSHEEDDYRVAYNKAALSKRRLEVVEQSLEIINRRIDETGTKEPIVQRQGEGRILVQVPGVEDPAALKKILGETAKMDFHLVNEAVTAEQLSRRMAPAGTMILPYAEGSRNPESHVAVFRRSSLSGELLTGANASYSEGQPVVEFSFNTLGAQKFGDITSDNIGKRFAVVLDNKVITAPVIRSAILGGRGIIEGNFDVASANELAILLRAGALPAPLTIVEERSVGPSLGADSIAAGKTASLIAIAAVMIFMLVAYGLFGIFADIALIMNVVIILGALSLLQATLTMPGIAGIVLTMGMAVDANTLIFERIREEARAGKGIMQSIESGFRNAYSTILDSNITTLIAAAILFFLGSGTIKGFAVTLAIGILSSMFTAVLLTRFMVAQWVHNVRPKQLPI